MLNLTKKEINTNDVNLERILQDRKIRDQSLKNKCKNLKILANQSQ